MASCGIRCQAKNKQLRLSCLDLPLERRLSLHTAVSQPTAPPCCVSRVTHNFAVLQNSKLLHDFLRIVCLTRTFALLTPQPGIWFEAVVTTYHSGAVSLAPVKPIRCRGNSAHKRQSRPDSGLDVSHFEYGNLQNRPSRSLFARKQSGLRPS